MKPYDSRRDAGTREDGKLADFLFAGVVVVPLVLALAGHLAGALLLFVPLLFAACLCGLWEDGG